MKTFFKTAILLMVLNGYSALAQVGLTGNNPDKSAALDLNSTNKGLLIPRIKLQSLTDKASISGGNPAISLLVFNTNTVIAEGSGYYYWDAAKWNKIESLSDFQSKSWELTGNTGTTLGTNYIGTKDAKNLQLKTNAEARITVTSNGNVGIATTSPNASSVLDMQSVTTSAITMPNVALTSLTDLVTVPSPVSGMMVYNTTNKMINVFDGTKWTQSTQSNESLVTPQLVAVAHSKNAMGASFTTGNIWYDTEDYDPENAMVIGTSTSVPMKYTVKQKGMHQVYLNYSCQNTVTGTTFAIRVKKNDVVIAALDAVATGGGGNASAFLVTLDDFEVGDVITVDKSGGNTGWLAGGLSKVTIFRFQ
ncbi:hypothetical protein GKZ90_0024595 [Flavobacterium sp. MC2016-06]|jgi:hypothetical protein|uniref:hypothetical protein n=1 Tax=Flavobacterium sp. MC2016-06 TaxID=2676308 RepID=UPI0012BA6B6B|nr:hypothetical protein [Flavobacterium sp. MC2016-06]MBU3862086.1 hypothetical protein [Flavobacterium sp. MC2016-06]